MTRILNATVSLNCLMMRIILNIIMMVWVCDFIIMMTFRRKLMPIEQRVIIVGEGGLNCTVNLVRLSCTLTVHSADQIKPSDILTPVLFASCMFGSSTMEKIEQKKLTTFSLRRGPTHPPNILPHIYPKCCDVGEKSKDPKGYGRLVRFSN